MASTSFTPSSSTPTSPPTLWDVFLCFRGTDTRYTFTDHLYKALHRTGIRTFMDDPELRSGEVISDSLIQAIQVSKTYIVVLSENYASSPWCLDELVEILGCCKLMKRMVVPVFYYIDPSVVRHQIGSFMKAFEKHQTRFDTDKVEKWRLALNEVADFSGYHISTNRSQADIIDEIVDRISLEINPKTLYVAKYPVGLDSHVKDITALLNSNTEGVIRIGIHGMGGVGKTTLAKAVYNQIYQRFQGSCFLANVGEVSRTENGLVGLQHQLIVDVLKCNNLNFGNKDQGIELIRAKLCSKKVLLVVDDLDNLKPLEYLEGLFALGSMIVITTRNEDLLDSIKVQAIYKVNELADDQSRKLFAQHAFGDYKIPDKFTGLTKEILERAGGLPLALTVFGSNLLNQPEEEWRWFIDKLKRVPVDDIEKKLLISFDALKPIDPMLQNIFLDIACFYIGWRKNEVVRITETFYTFVNRNIDSLTKRCLLTIDQFGILGMHDLLRDMGRKIARNNSPDEPGKHSRLWVSEDINTVLRNDEGTEAIQGIFCGYHLWGKVEVVKFVAKSFKRMSKLKFLYLNNVNLTGSFKKTFKELRWLHWTFFPLECLPSDFYAEKLVILELPRSNMRTWEPPRQFKKLKTLDMSGSHKLETTPNFIRLPCLETLNLEDCSSLEEVHVSIGSLVSLVHLNLGNCKKLRSLPDSICSLRTLKVLTITGCSRLEALPVELGSIESLETLKASKLSVSKLPVSIGCLSNLVNLDLSDNENLETLPDSICNLRSLEILDISHCKTVEELPDQLGMITSLRKLEVKKATMLRMLPDISQLSRIKHLDLYGFYHQLSISKLPNNLERIKAEEVETLDLSNFKQLKILDFEYCPALKEIQGLEEVTSLEYLGLQKCKSIERLPNLCNLKHLKEMNLNDCDSLKEIIGLEELTSLEDLKFGYCGNLLSVSNLPPNLKEVFAPSCASLKRLPNLSNLKQLWRLELTECSGLTEIQGLEELTSLEFLDLAGCNSSLLARTFTKHFFEILSGFRHEVKISKFRDWISQPSEFGLGIQFKLGSRMSLDLQPKESQNFLAIILAFKDYRCELEYTVKNITSGFIWSDTISYDGTPRSLIVIVPSSILSIRGGDDRIEITTGTDILCGIHLLYKTEITMIGEYCSTTVNVEDGRSNPLHSDLESNRKWLSLGSNSTTVKVGEQRSNPSDNNLENYNSATVDVEEERTYPSKRLKLSEITMISEYCNTTDNVEAQRCNPLYSDLESTKCFFLGSSCTNVNVGEERSNPSDYDLECNENWLSLGSSNTTVNVGEERSYPSKCLKHLECENNWLSL